MLGITGGFYRFCSSISRFLVNFSDLRVNNIKEQSYQGCIKNPLPKSKMSFVRIINSIAKSSVLDLIGVASDTYHPLLVTA